VVLTFNWVVGSRNFKNAVVSQFELNYIPARRNVRHIAASTVSRSWMLSIL
jgi:hypothetical protein